MRIIIIFIYLSIVTTLIFSKKDDTSLSLSVLRRHQTGDVIDRYILREHIDYIGVIKYLHASEEQLIAPTFNGEQLFLPYIDQSDQHYSTADLVLLSAIQQGNMHNQNPNCQRGEFCLNKNIFLGGHGEIWRGNRIIDIELLDMNTSYILKRMHVKNNLDILKCAERELFFGNQLKGDIQFTQLDSYFVTDDDFWLVFKDEGISLNNLLYAIMNRDINPVLQPSIFWKKMRTTKSGKNTMKAIMHQLMRGISILHEKHQILHRDIKPSNILINTEGAPRLIISDFSSAISDLAIQSNLYQANPSIKEETLKYAPPEVLISVNEKEEDPLAFDADHPFSYDIWSIGVVFLELILGVDDVFSVDQRTAAMISHRLRGMGEEKIKSAMLYASWSEYCIFEHNIVDTMTTTHELMEPWKHDLRPLTNSVNICGVAELSKAILRRDLLGLGFDDYWGLDLLRKLLQWRPADRINIAQSLNHAYFVGAYTSDIDGSEHATMEELIQYNVNFIKAKGDNADDDEDNNIEEIDLSSIPELLLLPAFSRHEIDESLLSCGTQGKCNITSSVSEDAGEDEVTRRVSIDQQHKLIFTCPNCSREFHDFESCNRHRIARKHGVKCLYDETLLPPCLSAHSLLPIDPGSGWCEYAGRRKYIEDHHSIVFNEKYKMFGVYDGHLGASAAKYASRNIQSYFDILVQSGPQYHSNLDMSNVDILRESNKERWLFMKELLLPLDTADLMIYDGISVATAVNSIIHAFEMTHENFLRVSNEDETSGTTATVAIMFEHYLLLSHVGDSRAVLCCTSEGLAVQLTVDHTPYDSKEARRILAAGGTIELAGVLRTNGNLAVTRSIGDRMVSVLSAQPDILLLDLRRLSSITYDITDGNAAVCSILLARTNAPFLIVASDGLWDVVSNDEATCLLCEYFLNQLDEHDSLPVDSFHNAARMLAQEAYVRGSMDNIGVCVIDLLSSHN